MNTKINQPEANDFMANSFSVFIFYILFCEIIALYPLYF